MSRSKALTIFGGIAAFALGAGSTIVLAHKPPQVPPLNEERRLHVYNANSVKYEDHSNSVEPSLKINKLREKVCSQIPAGSVILEVAAGTGRNLEYLPLIDKKTKAPLPTKCVLVDFSEGMLDIASKKAKDMNIPPDQLNIIKGDAHELPLPNDFFDVVLDTFGICSLNDPVKALKEWQRVVKPKGKIILLEHGKSTNSAINWFLSKYAPAHAHDWGCEWNKDILAIVKKADIGKIVVSKRHHLGTSYEIVIEVPESKSNASDIANADGVY